MNNRNEDGRCNHHYEPTTKGWKLCIQWKDGTTAYEMLSNMKKSCLIEVAQYAMANGIAIEQAFVWGVKHCLRKRQLFVRAKRTRYLDRTQKFGIHLPKTIDEAYAIDMETNTIIGSMLSRER